MKTYSEWGLPKFLDELEKGVMDGLTRQMYFNRKSKERYDWVFSGFPEDVETRIVYTNFHKVIFDNRIDFYVNNTEDSKKFNNYLLENTKWWRHVADNEWLFLPTETSVYIGGKQN